MNGVTSNGIFSRSAIMPTGLLLIISSLSFHGSILMRPPIGSAATFCELACGLAAACFGSADAVVATVAPEAGMLGRTGTRLPRCGLIRLGISLRSEEHTSELQS